jgi:hypothetical protein
VSLSAALTIAQIALPGAAKEVDNTLAIVTTTAVLPPILWLVSCAAIIFS